MSMKRKLLGGTALLMAAFSLNEASAETPLCTIPPTCESLGYDKNPEDCVDKAILKCPLDDTKIFCSNGPADGTAPVEPPATPTYKVGDTYYNNGEACGIIVSLDSTGKKGTVISSGNYTGTYAEVSNSCTNKSTCRLDWGIASSKSTQKKVSGCAFFYTSGGCCQVCGNTLGSCYSSSKDCSSGYCEAAF